VARLEALTQEVAALGLPAEPHLRQMIKRFVEAYADAQHRHRVLTEDVRFLDEADRKRVLAAESRVVAAFADAIARVRPSTSAAKLHKPLAMLLFGMINWLFTWLRPDGALTYESMAPIVADLFLGGLPAVKTPRRRNDNARAKARTPAL
jgi:TetR/AcrR family transcriptional regulator